MVLCCAFFFFCLSIVCFVEYPVLKGTFNIPILIAGYMDSRCQSTAAFVKEVVVFSTVSVVSQTSVTIIRF
jgi:hypothetical protein